MASPGIVLMREIGFSIANFTNAFKKLKVDKDSEGGIQQAKFNSLKLFFNNDFLGGNILAEGSKNFFLYQTSAKDPEALALNYIMENLSDQLVTETKSYYSAYQLLMDEGLQRAIFMSARLNRFNRFGETSNVDTAKKDVISRPEVWDKALEVSLKDIDPWKDPGFSIAEELHDNGTRLSAKKQKYKNTDQRLPIGEDFRFPRIWSRLEKPESYGKYPHTLTAVIAGKGEQKAVLLPR